MTQHVAHRASDRINNLLAQLVEQEVAMGESTAYALGLEGDIESLGDALSDALAALTATISLLQAGGRKGAPSNKMFNLMIADYCETLENGIEALKNANLMEDE